MKGKSKEWKKGKKRKKGKNRKRGKIQREKIKNLKNYNKI